MNIRFDGFGGISIAATVSGPEDGIPVLLLGGLGQTRHSWKRTAQRIAGAGYRAIAIDLRGHGDSDWSADGRYGFERTERDVRAIMQQVGRPAALVGASLGGKIGLVAASRAGPGQCAALVIVDTVPRTNPAGVADATSVLHPPPDGFASLDDAAAVLARGKGTNSPTPGAGEKLRRNMRQDHRGRWHWHWDPAWMDREQGIGIAAATEFLEECAGKVKIPVLLSRGGASNVVDDAGAAAFKAIVPQLEIVTIPGAAHMIVGDSNEPFAAETLRFLGRALAGRGA